MILENPAWLWLLLGIPVIITVFVLQYRHARNAVQVLGHQWDDPNFRGTVFAKTGITALLYCTFLIFTTLGLCGISWGEYPVEQDRKGLDVVYAVDVSLSMLARDMGDAARLEKARELVGSTAAELAGSRSAIVAFRGAATPLMPLTEDVTALDRTLPWLGPAVLTDPGTSLDAGLRCAVDAFVKGGNRHRVVIFLSDGENLQGDPSPAVRDMRKDGTFLVVVGMGDTAGSTVILDGGGPLRDPSGNVVSTRKDVPALDRLATIAGGVYLDGMSPGIYNRLVQTVRDFQLRHEQEGFRLEPVRRDAIFIALALLSLALMVVLRSFRWRNQW